MHGYSELRKSTLQNNLTASYSVKHQKLDLNSWVYKNGAAKTKDSRVSAHLEEDINIQQKKDKFISN